MQGVLRPSEQPGVDFVGPAGEQFTIAIIPEDDGSMRLKAATYAGVTKAGPQAAFRLLPGRRYLTTLIGTARSGEAGSLIEVSAGDALRRIRATTSPKRQYVIEGV